MKLFGGVDDLLPEREFEPGMIQNDPRGSRLFQKPGDAIDVSIELEGDLSGSATFLEILPSDWVPTSISSGGTFNSGQIRWRQYTSSIARWAATRSSKISLYMTCCSGS